MTALPLGDSPASVYRLRDEHGTLLYVGMATDPASRFAEHRKSIWWRWVSTREVTDPMPRGDAAQAEQDAIRTEAPVFNHAHNTAGGRAARAAYLAQRAGHQGGAPSGGAFLRVSVAWVNAVGLEAAAVFSVITWRAESTGSWKAARSELSEQTGLSAHKLRTAIDVLREVGWLTSERASKLDATLVWTPVFAASSQVSPRSHLAQSREVAGRNMEVAAPAISSIETFLDIPPTPGAAADAADEGFELVEEEALAAPVPDAFEEWWAVYPRRRKGDSKAAARKAYPRAVKRLGSPASVMAHLRAWLPELRARESDYLPQGASFLNDRDGKYAEPPPPRRHLAPVPTDPWADTGELPPAPSGDIYGLFTEVGR